MYVVCGMYVYMYTYNVYVSRYRRTRLINEDLAFPAKRCTQLTAVVHRPEAQVGSRTRSGTRETGLSGLHRGYFLRDNNNALCTSIMHEMDE